jgi:lysophospholipase L1-like esterase
MTINLFQDRDTTQHDLLNMLGGTSNPAQSNSQAQSNPNAPDYSRIGNFYKNQTPLGVYNLLRFGSERGGLEDVSPFSMSDIGNWAISSGALTPYQLEMAQQGKTVSNEDALMNLVRSVSPPPQPPKVTTAPVQPITNYTAQQEFLPQKPLGGIQGQPPGSDFTVEDYYRVMGEQPPAQPVAGMQSSTLSPEQFKQYIYSGGADDAEATRRGIEFVTQQGMSPQDAVSLWNQSLGTNFSVNDYFKTSGIQAPSRSVVFGDSISSVMGYNTDGSADTNYGKSLQDVLSNYTGGVVENVATGGQTSSDALLGNTGYGTFEKYIESNKPDQVILRYGAADAIKLGDASKSLDNIEQMIQIAQRNGSAPVLVGVSPFFGGADSIGGNIAGYLTRESATIADQINEGIKQLAEKYGLQFVDVRSIPIPSGSLLDGVHQDAKFGRQMADLIGNSIRGGSKPTMVAEEPVTKRDIGKVENRAGAYATRMRQGIGGLRG